MKKIILLSSLIIILVVSAAGVWSIVSDGYDRQNKVILLIKKFVPSTFARKIRDTLFIIPSLKTDNKLLALQVKKYEQKYEGNIFVEKNILSESGEYNFNLKKFFLPFKRLDLKMGWQAESNYKRAHYLEIIEDKIFSISGEGETIYFDKKNINEKKLLQKKINNNLNQILEEKNTELFAIRDLYYENNFIYISVVEKTSEGFTINIYRAGKNFDNLNFNLFFESLVYFPEYSLQSGGRIEKFKDNRILFSVGFFAKYNSVQDMNSLAGKIISIEKQKKTYEIISLGHRNPQGLFYSKKNNLIINTEHGPIGGDEVNFNFINDNKVKNFGWPISTYGKPYKPTKEIFEKNGWLKKSHKENSFAESIKYFSPAIGISELIYLEEQDGSSKKLYVSSLRAASIYILEIDDDMEKVLKTDRISFGDNRIRDLKYDADNEVFLIVFENTPAIGTLKFN